MASGRRPGFDARALEKKARENMSRFGLAPPSVAGDIRPGAVFVAKNEAISFPESRLPTAGEPAAHDGRYVIVLGDAAWVRARSPCTLLVVPCSASQERAASPWHYEIPLDEEAFSAKRVIAFAQLVQPILKSDLLDCKGVLSPPALLQLQAAVARNLGLIEDANAVTLEREATPGAVPAKVEEALEVKPG